MTLFKISKFFVYAALFSVVFVNVQTLFPFIVFKYVFFRSMVLAALVSFLLGIIFMNTEEMSKFADDAKRRLMSPLVIAVTIFVLAFLLACLFGFNPAYSFWSNFERGEGGFQMLNFYIFFLLLTLLFKEKKDWFSLFKVSLIVAIIMIAYGILAGLGVQGFIGVPLEIGQRFQGSLGNTAYVGTYLLFSIFYALYLLIDSRSPRSKIFLLPLIPIFLFFIWLTQTRGPFLGFAAGVAVFLAFLIFRGSRNAKRAGVVFLILLITLGTFLYQVRLSPVMQKLALSRLFNITLDNLSTQSRLWSWGTAIEGWKERPVFGWGPENYGRLFDKYFDTRHFIPNQPSDTWYDRAHSVFFDYLAETGLVGLLSYLGIFAVLFFWFFKRSSPKGFSLPEQGLNLAMTTAYLFQGLVIFDILPVYINLFLFLGFVNYKFHGQNI
ncbi:MAG TPA: O-antigen ligase family protein [Candidatus Paceibacterota bacterium]|nr:O-antigen ligase family protein [Candidatus Paceibacterota bacterium]